MDEVRLWVHPFFVRAGDTEGLIFRQGSLARFALTDVTRLDSGVVILTHSR